ncbi:MAG: hypothetical protein WDO18_10385 [Acidobacteriota bacterium]
MRTLLFVITAAAAAVAASAADIPSGAHVLLRLQNSVNTRSARVGDYVYLQTATPIAAEGSIVVPTGSYVQGVVAEVAKPGRVKGRAQMAIRLEVLTMPGGQQYKFEPRVASVDGDASSQQVKDREGTIQQGGTRGRDAAQIAIFAGQGAALGAIISRVSSSGGALRGAGIGGGAGAAVGLASVLLTRGRDVELHQGAGLDVVFDRAIALQ